MGNQNQIIQKKLFTIAKQDPLCILFDNNDFLIGPIITFNQNDNRQQHIGNFIAQIRHKKTNYDKIVTKMYSILGVKISPSQFEQILTKKNKTDYEKFLTNQYHLVKMDEAVNLLHKRTNIEIITKYEKLANRYLIKDYENNCCI